MTHQFANTADVVPHDRVLIPVRVGDRVIEVLALLPLPGAGPGARARAADPCLLMTFALSREETLYKPPYCIAPMMFLAQGHGVVSWDLPNHGTRINEHGEGITGLCGALRAGCDPFNDVVAEAKAVLDATRELGFAQPPRVVTAGTSRGGYVALRVAADEPRVTACAAFSPVTDWRILREFHDEDDQESIAALRLHRYAPQLAAKAVWLGIGRDDQRVSTGSCHQLFHDLEKAQHARGDGADLQSCFTDDDGHRLSDSYYRQGATFLLDHLRQTSCRK